MSRVEVRPGLSEDAVDRLESAKDEHIDDVKEAKDGHISDVKEMSGKVADAKDDAVDAKDDALDRVEAMAGHVDDAREDALNRVGNAALTALDVQADAYDTAVEAQEARAEQVERVTAAYHLKANMDARWDDALEMVGADDLEPGQAQAFMDQQYGQLAESMGDEDPLQYLDGPVELSNGVEVEEETAEAYGDLREGETPDDPVFAAFEEHFGFDAEAYADDLAHIEREFGEEYAVETTEVLYNSLRSFAGEDVSRDPKDYLTSVANSLDEDERQGYLETVAEMSDRLQGGLDQSVGASIGSRARYLQDN